MVFPTMTSVQEMAGLGLSIGGSYGSYGVGIAYAGQYTGTYAQASYGTGLYDIAPGMDLGTTSIIFSGNIYG